MVRFQHLDHQLWHQTAGATVLDSFCGRWSGRGTLLKWNAQQSP